MGFVKKPDKIQLLQIAIIKMAIASMVFLIFCIREMVLELISSPSDKKAGLFFSWHCILISLLGLLVLNNLFLIGGVICSKLIWMKAWTLAQLIVLIGQLHVIIVDLLVRKMYADCLMILLCSVWTVLFVLIVYKCIQYMEERQMNEAPLLPNEDL